MRKKPKKTKQHPPREDDNRCGNKTRYATSYAARAAAAMNRKGQVPYTCEQCDGWHISGG